MFLGGHGFFNSRFKPIYFVLYTGNFAPFSLAFLIRFPIMVLNVACPESAIFFMYTRHLGFLGFQPRPVAEVFREKHSRAGFFMYTRHLERFLFSIFIVAKSLLFFVFLMYTEYLAHVSPNFIGIGCNGNRAGSHRMLFVTCLTSKSAGVSLSCLFLSFSCVHQFSRVSGFGERTSPFSVSRIFGKACAIVCSNWFSSISIRGTSAVANSSVFVTFPNTSSREICFAASPLC